MGKLHSLKRAIKRNPEKFFQIAYNISDEVIPIGVRKYNNKCFKIWEGTYSFDKSYRNFVKKVLIELGYKIFMRR
jgi:hypothetical protein